MLYPGEAVAMAAGYPALVRFEPGQPAHPLVVFVTGGGVLARIAYGPPGARTADFLCHQLHQAGFPTLALSYPMDSPLFEATYPQFSMRDWAEQSADLVAEAVQAHGLPRQVIVLGWSMAGRIPEPLAAALGRRNLATELFIALAGGAPLPNLLPGLDGLEPSAKGLARVRGSYADWLLLCLAGQNAEAGRAIIEPATFTAEFLADFPIRLAASARRYEDGAFVPDPQADADAVGAFRYSDFPPLAFITHTSPIDARHAVTDRAAWGFLIAQSLAEKYLFGRVKDAAALPPDRWNSILQLIQRAPDRLGIMLPGNHMFYVGEKGASGTVAAIERLRLLWADLRSRLEAALP